MAWRARCEVREAAPAVQVIQGEFLAAVGVGRADRRRVPAQQTVEALEVSVKTTTCGLSARSQADGSRVPMAPSSAEAARTAKREGAALSWPRRYYHQTP